MADMTQAGMHAVYDSGYVTGEGTEADFWNLLRERTGLRGDDAVLAHRVVPFQFRPAPSRAGSCGRGCNIACPVRHLEPATADLSANHFGMGRELFEAFRHHAGRAETGASVISYEAAQA